MKTIVGIFAHPDDEAFGPGGTLAKLAKENEVYLICVTKGQAGKNSLNSENLTNIREEELHASAKVLGIKKVYFLDFQDGDLSNNLYHQLAKEIEEILTTLNPETIITFEPRGLSGHIDHIVVSMVCSFLFWKMSSIESVWQYCSPFDKNQKQDYFIYMPPGYKKNEIDKTISVEDVWETKLEAMHCHKSQMHDVERFLQINKDLPKEERFLIVNKS